MSEPLPCPQCATEVHQSISSDLATATGTLYVLRLMNNPSFPVQSSVVMCPVLRFLLEFLHRQLCTFENYGGQLREPSATVAAKLLHTCGLVDELPFVWMVKVGGQALFRNQHVKVGLCTVYGRPLHVHVRADQL